MKYILILFLGMTLSSCKTTMTVFDPDKFENKTVTFADLTDNLGATTIEDYVDILANTGFYRDNNRLLDVLNDIDSSINTGSENSNTVLNEIFLNTRILGEVTDELREIKELLTIMLE